MTTKQVALFSIPGCVCFPHTRVPLHVFEPRYREMVNHCIDKGVLMGVCHTQKVVHQKEKKQSLQEALNSNQSTYKPQEVFSVGQVELLETLSDGRMHIMVNMQERVSLERETQTLPFSMAEVSVLPDEAHSNEEETHILKDKILHRCIALFANNPNFVKYLQSPEIEAMSGEEFSYAIFSLVRLEPEIQQDILEIRSARDRLSAFLDMINA